MLDNFWGLLYKYIIYIAKWELFFLEVQNVNFMHSKEKEKRELYFLINFI